MIKPIKNPFIVFYSKRFKSWSVSQRYLINGEIRFEHICSTDKRKNADKIAKVLNETLKRERENNKNETNPTSDNNKPALPVASPEPIQTSFDFM